MVDELARLARLKGVTPAQLALAWLHHQGVLPIPGTKRRTYLEQNASATDVQLSADELAAVDAIAPHGIAAGDRGGERPKS